MDKYGVDELEADKTANDQDTVDMCPTCGAKLSDINDTGGIKHCPNCGTKPFEAV